MEKPQKALLPLLGCIRVEECIQLIGEDGLLAASIILYPPQVKHSGLKEVRDTSVGSLHLLHSFDEIAGNM